VTWHTHRLPRPRQSTDRCTLPCCRKLPHRVAKVEADDPPVAAADKAPVAQQLAIGRPHNTARWVLCTAGRAVACGVGAGAGNAVLVPAVEGGPGPRRRRRLQQRLEGQQGAVVDVPLRWAAWVALRWPVGARRSQQGCVANVAPHRAEPRGDVAAHAEVVPADGERGTAGQGSWWSCSRTSQYTRKPGIEKPTKNKPGASHIPLALTRR
jgi:hypothetical protein